MFLGDAVGCETGHTYPVESETVDFLPGSASPDEEWTAARPPDYHGEVAGMLHRMEQFLLPRLLARYGDLSTVTALDDGCGFGTLVEELVAKGADAYGVDSGSRTYRWRESPVASRLYRADGTRLPFLDRSFDVVTSCGVLEHVGESLPVAERDALRRRYVSELVRVLRPGGFGLVSHPNGAHPIDYWHSAKGTMRLHRPYEGWMPSARDLGRWTSDTGYDIRVTFLSPEGFLAFNRVRRYRYGRLLYPPMRTLFRLFTRFPSLSRSVLSPWLVTEIERL